MLHNNIKTGYRSLLRNKNLTIINILGLAVGIAVCMMIFIIIQFHTSFDEFHTKKDRIYRVLTKYDHADAISAYGKDVPFPLPEALKTAFPQIEQIAPIFASHSDQLLIPDDGIQTIKTFKENKGVFFTTPQFFKIFDYPLIAGSYESLNDPNNVLITQEIAEKYFGGWESAMGKTIHLEAGGYIFEHGTESLKVSGILAPIAPNTDFQLKLVVAFGTGFTGSLIAKSTNWEDKTNAGYGCYILLPPNISIDNFNQQLQAYSLKVGSLNYKDSHFAQPLAAIHYDTHTGNYSNKTISHELLNILRLIGVFILSEYPLAYLEAKTQATTSLSKSLPPKYLRLSL